MLRAADEPVKVFGLPKGIEVAEAVLVNQAAGNTLPALKYGRQGFPGLWLKENMHMVRHDDVTLQPVALIIEMMQTVGHYVAGTQGKSPIPMLEKHHDRIVSLHLKDRTADGSNVPWGQGQTPIKEVLQLMRQEKWTFPAEIELKHKIPECSNAVAEVAKRVQYCKEALA